MGIYIRRRREILGLLGRRTATRRQNMSRSQSLQGNRKDLNSQYDTLNCKRGDSLSSKTMNLYKRPTVSVSGFHFLTYSSNTPLGEKGRPGFAVQLFSYLQWSQLPSLFSSPWSQADSISRLALPQGEAPTANVDIYPKKIYEYRV